MFKFCLASCLILLSFPATSRAQITSESNEDQYKCGQTIEILEPLIQEAEQGRFTLRRIETSGNERTRHREFTKRLAPDFNEGFLFTRRSLEKALVRVSKIRSIYPIKLENIEMRLLREHKKVDLMLCVKERPRK